MVDKPIGEDAAVESQDLALSGEFDEQQHKVKGRWTVTLRR
jgi:hypothetical protein